MELGQRVRIKENMEFKYLKHNKHYLIHEIRPKGRVVLRDAKTDKTMPYSYSIDSLVEVNDYKKENPFQIGKYIYLSTRDKIYKIVYQNKFDSVLEDDQSRLHTINQEHIVKEGKKISRAEYVMYKVIQLTKEYPNDYQTFKQKVFTMWNELFKYDSE